MESVISDYLCLEKWYDSGILSKVSASDTRLYVVDYSIDSFGRYSRINSIMLDYLKSSGLLQIVELTEKQNLKAYELFSLNSNILFESVAALVFAEQIKGKFITEDTQVMDFAYRNFNVSVYALRSIKDDWQERSNKNKKIALN